jgi:ribosomal protein S27E
VGVRGRACAGAQVVMDVAGVLITCAVCRAVIPVVAGLAVAAP